MGYNLLMTTPKRNRNVYLACLVALLMVIFGTMYAVVQQAQRSVANNPQIQLAQDAAYRLSSGDTPASLVGHNVLIDSSLDPFMVIYDSSGEVVASSGFLTGTNLPVIPIGVLTAAKGQSYHAVTWQPAKYVRIAAVIVASKHYYILSGRSLTEVEKNENKTFWLSFAGGAVSLITVAVGYFLSQRTERS